MMSNRELKFLQELSGTRDVARKSLRSGLVRGATMDADPQLEERLAQLEAELSQARHSLAQKDFELDSVVKSKRPPSRLTEHVRLSDALRRWRNGQRQRLRVRDCVLS